MLKVRLAAGSVSLLRNSEIAPVALLFAIFLFLSCQQDQTNKTYLRLFVDHGSNAFQRVKFQRVKCIKFLS